jgi:large subunit ribosomal protein L25
MSGDIPAVVYGPETESQSILVTEKAFHAALKAGSGTTIFDVSVDGQSTRAILRDIQRDPLTSNITHLDFYAISDKRELHLRMPLTFVGTPKGVHDEGGILQIILRELEIYCLPTNIPDEVNVDVSALSIGDSIHVEQIEIPNVEILTDPERTVVTISAPTVLKTTAEGAEEEGVEGEEGAEAAEGEEGAEAAEGAEEGGEKEE